MTCGSKIRVLGIVRFLSKSIKIIVLVYFCKNETSPLVKHENIEILVISLLITNSSGGNTARVWPPILTPFDQRQNIESCATRTSSLFEFKQTFDLPKA